jgi:hypothetical protein
MVTDLAVYVLRGTVGLDLCGVGPCWEGGIRVEAVLKVKRGVQLFLLLLCKGEELGIADG